MSSLDEFMAAASQRAQVEAAATTPVRDANAEEESYQAVATEFGRWFARRAQARKLPTETVHYVKVIEPAKPAKPKQGLFRPAQPAIPAITESRTSRCWILFADTHGAYKSTSYNPMTNREGQFIGQQYAEIHVIVMLDGDLRIAARVGDVLTLSGVPIAGVGARVATRTREQLARILGTFRYVPERPPTDPDGRANDAIARYENDMLLASPLAGYAAYAMSVVG